MMHKISCISLVSLLLVFLLSFSSFADAVTLSYDQVKCNLSVSSFRYTVFDLSPSVTPSTTLGSFYGNSNGSTYVGTFGDIVCAHNILTYSSIPDCLDKPTMHLNIPFYLYNVASIDFDFFFTFASFQGTTGNMKNCYTTPADQYANLWEFDKDVLLFDKDNQRFYVRGALVYRGVAYFTVPNGPGTNHRLPFLKFSIHVDVPQSANYSVKYIRISSNEMPYQQIFDGTNQKFCSVLGLQPDNPYIVTSNPQLGVIQADLDELSSQFDENLEKLDDLIDNIDTLNSNVTAQTERILYEVSPENQLIINNITTDVDRVKTETEYITDGLAVSEEWQDEEGTMNAISFDSIMDNMPEDFEDTSTEVSDVLQSAFSDTPLTELLILVFTFATIGYILFGKKAT